MSDELTRAAAHQRDPLGLADLPLLEPPNDGWPAIEHALSTAKPQRRIGRWALAAAASMALATLLLTLLPQQAVEQAPLPLAASPGGQPVQAPAQQHQQDQRLADLISLSQGLETRLRALREQTASLPAQSAFYVAELEDTIAQVDNAISATPEALDLWGQRVNLLLDLELLYEQQWQREYGRMASL